VIVIVIVVLAVLVVVAIVWARIASARSENRSVETYEHALGVLGEVSKRTESTGFRILPHEETGRPHVGRPVDEAGDAAAAGPAGVRPGQGPLVSPRLPPAGQPKVRFSGPARQGDQVGANQRTGGPRRDDQGTGAPPGTAPDALAAERPPAAGGRALARSDAGVRGGAHKSSADRRRQVMGRRVATGGAAAVAVAAVTVAAISLSGGGGTHAPKVTTTTVRHAGKGRTTTTTTTSTTLPTTLKPTSVTPSNVSFTVPSGTYTLAFQATGGACWIGIEHSSAGPWLFAETLSAGQSATYQASGAYIVTLGAPAFIAVRVNGLVAELPSGFKQAYNVELTPASA